MTGRAARAEFVRSAGIEQSDIVAEGVGPVTLEQTVRYARELRAGDGTTVSCAFEWSPGRKVFSVRQELRTADGTLAAGLTAVVGMLDLRARRLVADPRAALRELASAPEAIGLERHPLP